MAVGAEIERKFLVADIAAAVERSTGSEPIAQAYVAIDPHGVEVRARRRGDTTVLTVKRGAGLRREEVEFGIAETEFERLWELAAERRIDKRRHYVREGGRTIELDVYGGELEGLAVAEVEFESEAAAEAWVPPAWLGRELTGDERYSNAALARDGLPG